MSFGRSTTSIRFDERGAVAMILAFCLVMLAALVGGAVDFARFYQASSAYRAAIDAAILAGARIKQTGGTDEAAVAAAKAYLAATKSRIPVDGDVVFKVVEPGTAMSATGSLSVRTSFLPVIRLEKLPFGVSSVASFSLGSVVELSLMLDITGSMSGGKIRDLKEAVNDLVDIVVKDEGEARSRIAVAPFSNAVRLKARQYSGATGLPVEDEGDDEGNGKNYCVVERPGADAYTDASPAAGRTLTPLSQVAPQASCKENSVVIPLTGNRDELKRLVRNLDAGGSTAGHLGTAWAWYLLSPNWSNIYEAASRPGSYADLTAKDASGNQKLRKIAVLMTDGEYNTQYIGADSTTQARAICAEMKRTGIEVFTVGFQVGGSATVLETLRGCASSPSNFYEATSGDALKSAFRDIALKSTPLRLAK